MGRDLGGTTVVVLGGTGNLGRAVVERLRSEGAAVVVANARTPPDADRQPDVRYETVDALDEAIVSAALAAVSPAPAAVGNLIGGYTPPQRVADLDVSVLRQQLELNLLTATIVTKHAMPLLAARGG